MLAVNFVCRISRYDVYLRALTQYQRDKFSQQCAYVSDKDVFLTSIITTQNNAITCYAYYHLRYNDYNKQDNVCVNGFIYIVFRYYKVAERERNMIVRDKPSAFQLFFILKGSVVPMIYPQIIFITLLSTLIVMAQHKYPILFPTNTIAPFTLLGVAISLFLGFRNNACYDRWWEARKQWGQLIVNSRSLARQVYSFIDSEKEGGELMQKRLINLTIAFNHALRHHLRNSEPWNDIEKYLDADDINLLKKSQNVPDSILRLMGLKLGTCRHKNLLSDFLIQSIDEHITSMAVVQASCERIKNTPLPFAYRLLVQRTVYLYCIILPFGLVDSQGLATPLFSAIVAYTFFGLDALSEELEKPFGLSFNDLPLHAMTRSVEISLLEMMGEEDLPEEIEAKLHLLE